MQIGYLIKDGWLCGFIQNAKIPSKTTDTRFCFSSFFFFYQITSLFPNALIWNVMHRLFTRESFKIIDILKVIVERKPLILLVDKYDSYALGKQKENEENIRVL